MKKITEFLGKPVISLLEGNIEGYVKNVVFDKTFKKVKYLVIFEDNEFQDEKMLEISKIYNIGDNAIVIKNNSCLELVKQEVLPITNHINCKVFTTLGKYVGIIADIEISENFLTNCIILTNQTILNPSNFLSFGQDVFIMQDPTKIVKIANIRKRENLLDLVNNNLHKVNIMPSQTEDIKLLNNQNLSSNSITETKNIEQTENEINRKKYEFNNASIPKKIIGNNSDFLIGRKTTKTIYSASNEVVVRKNVIINQKIIQQAILFNKLRELSIYSV